MFAENAEVYADSIGASGDTVTVPLSIRGNPGLMGFKLIVKYDSSILQPRTVTRGTVTQSGMMNDSIGAGESGTLLIVWSDTDAVKADGKLAVLTFHASTQTDTALTVSYSQPDTFDGDFNDVALDCKPVEIRFGSEVITTTLPVTKQPNHQDIIAAVDSVDNKTDVSAINEAVARLTGTEDAFASPQEVESAYHNAAAINFTETVLLAVDGNKIDAAIHEALNEVGAETVDTVPQEMQTEFIRAVEAALQAEAPDVPTISDVLSPEQSIQAINNLQTKSEEEATAGTIVPIQTKQSKSFRLPTVIGVCTVAVVLLICIILVRKRRE